MNPQLPPRRPILAPLDEALLRSRGLTTQSSQDGVRKLHRRRMNRSSDSENDDIPLDVSPSAPNSTSAFATIPTFLISKATLLHVGFEEWRASQLWQRWANQPQFDYEDEEFDVSFLQFILRAISPSHDTTTTRDEDWIASMTLYGINPELRTAIIDPQFNLIRHSQSCAFWIKDTIEMRYAALEQIQKTSKERHTLLSQGITAEAIEARYRSDFQTETARALAARNAPGHTILYKGIDEGRVANFIQDWNPRFLHKMRSTASSDFSPSRFCYYFTTQRPVAQYYAAWVTRRNTNTDAEARPKPIILQFAIPNHSLESLPPREKLQIFWPNSEWKSLIWRCRTAQLLPRCLEKYLEATLIIGTVAKGDNGTFFAMRSEEEVTIRNVLRFGPPRNLTPAIQFVFTDQKGGNFLTQHISGFSRESFNAREYREWRYNNRHLTDAWDDN